MCRVKPILFNTDMVRAILDEHKTSTRRVIKYDFHEIDGYVHAKKAPYQAGDILYVRETWHKYTKRVGSGKRSRLQEFYGYKANIANSEDANEKWHPSTHMPKEAARIFLRVIDVRVERLQDMKWYDFISEGVCIRPEAFNDPENAYGQAKEFFVKIWDSTLKKADKDKYSWDANPWVWVIDFQRCEKPEKE